jgi:hypothetical protein
MSLATWAGVVVGVGALVFAWLAWRVSRKQLKLAQEEAELRPDLEVSFNDVLFHHRPPNPGSRYVQAAIRFYISNNGRSAAHNVHCEIRLDEERLELDDMHGPNRDYSAPYMGPKSTKAYAKNVGIRVYGPTEAHYRCVCDEVGDIEGAIEFEVPEKSS